MAETEDIQPLVCDNGTGMVKVLIPFPMFRGDPKMNFLIPKGIDRDS